MQVVVDSLLTQYEKTGNGQRTVLLLHGWGDTHKTFAQLQPELAKSFTVISLDLPGFGATQAPASVWGLEDYAQFVNSFSSKLRVKQVDAVVAHSNGAAVAIRGVAQGVISTDKLVLIGAAGIRDQETVKRWVVKIVAKVGKLATIWLPLRYRKKLQKKLYGKVGSDMLVVPALEETFKKTVRQDVQADAKMLIVPTLLVYGSNDKATPPFYGEIYQKLIAGSKLLIVDGATHFVHHEEPEQVGQAIQEFLK